METRDKDKGVDEEGFAVGRILGVIKRKDPQLYEELLSIAKADGMKGSDVVYEALQLYRDFRLFSGADPRCIAYAMRMIEVMMRRVLEILAFTQQYMSADFFARQISMYQALAEQLRAQSEVKEEGKEAKVSMPSSAREKLMNLVVDVSTALVKSLISMLTSTATSTIPRPPPAMSRTKIVIGEKSERREGESGQRHNEVAQPTREGERESFENSK